VPPGASRPDADIAAHELPAGHVPGLTASGGTGDGSTGASRRASSDGNSAPLTDGEDACLPPLHKAARAEDDLCVHGAGGGGNTAHHHRHPDGLMVGPCRCHSDASAAAVRRGRLPPSQAASAGEGTPISSRSDGSDVGGIEGNSYDGSESGGAEGTPSTSGDITPVGPAPPVTLRLSVPRPLGAAGGGGGAGTLAGAHHQHPHHQRRHRGRRGGPHASQPHSVTLHDVAEGGSDDSPLHSDGGSEGGKCDDSV